MTNNCLVTKLKESVSNDSLRKLGCISFNVNCTGEESVYQRRLSLKANSNNVEIKVVGNGSFTVDGNSTSYTTYTLIANRDYYFNFNAGTYKVEITNKYDLIYSLVIDNIGLNRVFTQSIGDFSYCENITDLSLSFEIDARGNINELNHVNELKFLNLNHTNVEGDIKYFGNFLNLSTLDIQESQIVGDIVNLSKNISLTVFKVSQPGVVGSIESLAEGMLAQPTPRTSGTLFVQGNGKITYNGQVFPSSGVTITFSDGSYTVVVN